MSERAAFERAVAENPADDTARLVYADWLEERDEPAAAGEQRLVVALRAVLAAPEDDGPRLAYADVCERYGMAERAEFIRVQLALARCGEHEPHFLSERTRAAASLGSDWAAEWDRLRRREEDLFDGGMVTAVLGGTIWPGLAQARCEAFPDRGRPIMFLIRRGFLDEVRVTGSAWEEYGDIACEQHPVRKVTFADNAPALDDATTRSDHSRGVFRYRLAGRMAELWEADVMRAGTPEAVCRLILSARWPRVPADGWVFPAQQPLGEPPFRGAYEAWAATPPGRTPLDDLRAWQERALQEIVRGHGLPPGLVGSPGQPPAGG